MAAQSPIDRGELFQALQRLDSFYTSSAGLRRPIGVSSNSS